MPIQSGVIKYRLNRARNVLLSQPKLYSLMQCNVEVLPRCVKYFLKLSFHWLQNESQTITFVHALYIQTHYYSCFHEWYGLNYDIHHSILQKKYSSKHLCNFFNFPIYFCIRYSYCTTFATINSVFFFICKRNLWNLLIANACIIYNKQTL